MFFVPGWLTNILLLITCYLAGYQHVQLDRPNPIKTLQFGVIIFSLLMILVVVFCNHINPWLSAGFFLAAAGSLAYMIRQHRMLPPRKSFE